MIEPDRMNELLRMCAACPKMCRHVCPTFFAWRSDAPTPHGRALLMHQETVGAHAMDTRAIEVLYQCLECSHCLTWCKPEVDIAAFVEIKRRDLVRSDKQPTGILKLVNLVKKTHNPYGEDQANRNDWIATGRTNGTKIFYFTGCTAAYREKSIAQDTVTLLEQIGYSVEISPDEWCCGSPLFRTGNIDLGLEMAKHNVMSLNQSDADSILVTCPSTNCCNCCRNARLSLETSLLLGFKLL
ncbi:MAG: (Fe-S)-binding protein [Promethearchaeota archaeon]